LGELLTLLRQEARLSTNAAHNASTADAQRDAIRRTQEALWEDYDWPHLEVDRYINLQAGQRFYDPTTTLDVTGAVKNDIAIDRITCISVMDGGDWRGLTAEIGRDQYVQYQSDLDERSWPVTNWRLYEDEQIEVWPIPNENADAVSREGQIKITATRTLRPMIADKDTPCLT
jgi:hypothetical protein